MPQARALAQLPPDGLADRGGPGLAAAAAYFCTFVALCSLILVNFVIGGAPLQMGWVAHAYVMHASIGCLGPAWRAMCMLLYTGTYRLHHSMIEC